MRTGLALTTALVALPALAFAQSGQPKLQQLELDGRSGYAVVIAPDGNEHYCEAEVTRDSVDLGPCKPLQLITPLVTSAAQPQAVETRGSMRSTVIQLFEQAGCAISYSYLENALTSVSELRQKAVAGVISEMTDRGEIVDDLRNERAVLRVGNRCS